jgi:hypothetical protein
MAAAVHRNWLLPGHRHGAALGQVDRVVSFHNSSDPALRYYRFIDHSRPAALGFTGLSGGRCLGPYAPKYSEENVACIVGSAHDWSRYVCSSHIMAQVREMTFGGAEQIHLALTPVTAAGNQDYNRVD